MKFAVAHTDDPFSQDAAAILLRETAEQLGGRIPQAGILFAGIDHEHQALLDAILAHYPGLALVGCTTDGEFSSPRKNLQDSACLCLIASEHLEIRAGVAETMSKDPFQAGRDAVKVARADSKLTPSLCLTFPESLTSSAGLVLQGIQEELGNQRDAGPNKSVPILGGSSADQLRFQKTYQFCGNRVFRDAVPVLLFFGPIQYGAGLASGVKPFGAQGVLTKGEGTVLYEIDHRPAVEFYHSQVGAYNTWEEMVANVVAFPLAVKHSAHWYLRNVREFDLERGALICFSDVPVGATIRIGHSNRPDLLTGTRESLQAAIRSYGTDKRPDGALLFSCASRRMSLGTQALEEIASATAALKDIPAMGFYTYGEICNLEAETVYHNTSFVCLLLGEV